jgi:hypothetical protein
VAVADREGIREEGLGLGIVRIYMKMADLGGPTVFVGRSWAVAGCISFCRDPNIRLSAKVFISKIMLQSVFN